MKFADKMKDVELNPYMLAIYKDNKHYHLLQHALEAWEYRSRSGQYTSTGLSSYNIQITNPIVYAAYPSLELIKQYGIRPNQMITSRVLKCPIVAKWAFEEMLAVWSENPEVYNFAFDKNLGEQANRVVSLIQFDEELTYKVICAGMAPYMPEAFQRNLTEEQLLSSIICA